MHWRTPRPVQQQATWARVLVELLVTKNARLSCCVARRAWKAGGASQPVPASDTCG